MDKKLDCIIIGSKESRDYFKIVIRKIETEGKCKLSSRGKNIDKMLKLAAYLIHTKDIKSKSVILNVGTFTPEGKDNEIIVPELVIELTR